MQSRCVDVNQLLISTVFQANYQSMNIEDSLMYQQSLILWTKL